MEEHTQALSPDASRYLDQMKRKALEVLFPRPDEMRRPGTVDFITELSGSKPNINKIVAAAFEWEIQDSIIYDRPINWDSVKEGALVSWLKRNAPSIGGKRASQAVEIARATESTSKRSWLSKFFGG